MDLRALFLAIVVMGVVVSTVGVISFFGGQPKDLYCEVEYQYIEKDCPECPTDQSGCLGVFNETETECYVINTRNVTDITYFIEDPGITSVGEMEKITEFIAPRDEKLLFLVFDNGGVCVITRTGSGLYDFEYKCGII